jgi:hypothetical protein
VIVGVAGFFAAAAKTPLSTLVTVSEMTGSYNLLLPTLWVCTISFLLSDEQSTYSSHIAGRAQSPADQAEFVQEMLSRLSVARFVALGDLLDRTEYVTLVGAMRARVTERFVRELISRALNDVPR